MVLEIKDLHLNHASLMPHCNNSILSSTVHPKVTTPFFLKSTYATTLAKWANPSGFAYLNIIYSLCKMKSKSQEFQNKMETGKCDPGIVWRAKTLHRYRTPHPDGVYFSIKGSHRFFFFLFFFVLSHMDRRWMYSGLIVSPERHKIDSQSPRPLCLSLLSWNWLVA